MFNYPHELRVPFPTFIRYNLIGCPLEGITSGCRDESDFEITGYCSVDLQNGIFKILYASCRCIINNLAHK